MPEKSSEINLSFFSVRDGLGGVEGGDPHYHSTKVTLHTWNNKSELWYYGSKNSPSSILMNLYLQIK